MPFLKSKKKREPWTKLAEEQTFKTGLRHLIFTPAGDRYKGEWLKNEKSSKGAEIRVNGHQYEGEWLRDKKHGWGKSSVWIEEDKCFRLTYLGEYKNNKRDGFGYRHYKNGDFYEGEFEKGKRGKQGRCWYVDGSFYEGQWENDLYHGYGMFVQTNGNRYEGEWYKGLKNGWGKFYHLDSGQVQIGYWKDGSGVTSLMQDITFRQSSVEPTYYPIPKLKLQKCAPCFLFLQQAEDKFLRFNEGCIVHKFCYPKQDRPTSDPNKVSE